MRSFKGVAALAAVLLASASALHAQSIRITTAPPTVPLYPDQFFFSFQVRATATHSLPTARARLLIREVTDSGATEIRGLASESTIASGAEVTLTSGTYRVPEVTCYPDCASTVQTLAPTIRKVLRIELVAVLLDRPNGTEVARSAPLVHQVAPHPEIVSIVPAEQPLHGRAVVRIVFRNTLLTQARVFVYLLHSQDFSLRATGSFAPGSTTPCDSTPNLSLCGFRVIDDTTLEATVRSFVTTGTPQEIARRVGLYDVLVQTQAPIPAINATTPRIQHAVRLAGYRFTDPITDDLIRLEKLTVLLSPNQGANSPTVDLLPADGNYLPAMLGQQVGALAGYSFRLSRLPYATLWWVVREKGKTPPISAVSVRLTNSSGATLGSDTVRPNFTSQRFPLPAQPSTLEFLLTVTPEGAASFEDRAFARSAVIEFATGPLPDLTVDHIEVVQAVQTPSNDVPLVAGKGTVVRVFVKLGDPLIPSIPGIRATLRGSRDGAELTGSPLQPAREPLTLPREIDRNRTTHSLNFYLPDDWTKEGALDLTVRLNPSAAILEATATNNQLNQRVIFSKRATLNVGYLIVCHQPPGKNKVCPSAEVPNLDTLTQKLYPMADDALFYFPLPIPAKTWRAVLQTPNQRKLLTAWLNQLYALVNARTAGAVDQLVAWLPKSPEIPILGWSDPLFLGGAGHVTIAVDNSADDRLDAESTLAHEMGHNLGLHHQSKAPPNNIETCGALDNGTDWTFPDATIQEAGFDPQLRTIRSSTKHDVMSYCSPGINFWISPFHYRKLYDANLRPVALPAPAAPVAVPQSKSAPRQSGAPKADPLEVIVVNGTAEQDGSAGQLDRAYRIASTDPPPPSIQGGNHCLRFSGDAGVIDQFCFNLSFRDPENNEVVSTEAFSVRAPVPAGATRVALMRGEQELASLAASGGAPSLSITEPQAGARWDGGSRQIAWSASDPDGDALSYALYYSADGGVSWLPLEADLTDSQFILDTSSIRGGANVMFRVLATDGFLTTAATSGTIEIVQAPTIELSAQTVDFGEVEIGDAVSRTINLSNPGTGPLLVSAVRSEPPVFRLLSPRAAVEIPAGGRFAVTVSFRPSSAGAATGAITIESNDVQRPQIRVPLTGRATAP